MSSLSEVASAGAGTLDIDKTLDTIVAHAKRIVHADKMLLVLLDEASGSIITDEDSVFVRGRRKAHPQYWWLSKLDEIAERVETQRACLLELDEQQKAWVLCVPVRAQERSIGLLCAINTQRYRFTQDQIDFVSVLGVFAGFAIENARLMAESQHSLLASERDRIAREMHDGLAQSLFSASLGLEVCKRAIPHEPETAVERLEEIQSALGDSLVELRRYIYDLRPARLDRLGLRGAITEYAKQVAGDGEMSVEVVVDGRERQLAPSTEACLYQVAREAVTNAIKHADCSRIHIMIEYGRQEIAMLVLDDGCGFDVDEAWERAELDETLGLRNIRSRVNAENGVVRLNSVSHAGTRVSVRLPA